MMRDLDAHAGLAADTDRLAHGVEQARGLVAHVSRVDSAGRGHVAGQFDDLFGRAMAARFINEPGGEADRAGVESFAHQVTHRALLVLRGRAARHPHHGGADGIVPDQHRDVEARRSALDHFEVAAITLPSGHRCVTEESAEVVAHRLVGRRTHPAVANHLRGDTLHQLEVHRGRGQHREVVVAMDVDEAGREREAARVDLELAACALDFADRHDPIAAHREAAKERRRAGAVEDARAANDDVPAIVGHIKSYASKVTRVQSVPAKAPIRSRPARRGRRERRGAAQGSR